MGHCRPGSSSRYERVVHVELSAQDRNECREKFVAVAAFTTEVDRQGASKFDDKRLSLQHFMHPNTDMYVYYHTSS